MKGTFFQKPFEFRSVINGESWHQGDTVNGTLEIKNHDSAAIALTDINVSLAYGDSKKVHQKENDAFSILTSIPVTTQQPLAPQGTEKLDWEFKLERNCPITDKSGSLYLLYGPKTTGVNTGQLQLNVLPVAYILEFLKILQIEFKFVVRFMKSSKNYVDVKLVPPSSKTFASMNHVNIQFRYKEDNLEIRYIFNVNEVNKNGLAKVKREFEQSFAPNEYLLHNNRLNHEKMQQTIEDVLKRLGSGNWWKSNER